MSGTNRQANKQGRLMQGAFKQLDGILRGEATQQRALRAGHIDLPIGGLAGVVVLLAAFYGVCMGVFAVIRTGGEMWMQLVASAVKLPLLFFLTLVVTLPSLYVFNALVGSRLSLMSVLRLLVAMLGVTLAVLASLGPIVVFFSVSTTSYPFMQLLNVAMCTVAGFLGLAFLLRTLHRLVRAQELLRAEEVSTQEASPAEEQPQAAEGEGEDAEAEQAERIASKRELARKMHTPETHGEDQRIFRGALERDESGTDRRARTVFQIWVVVFALVGAQMSWVLRPFIGAPGLPFEWFREREGNFFLAVLKALWELLGITGG